MSRHLRDNTTRDETAAEATRAAPSTPGEPPSAAEGQQARLARNLAWGAVLAALIPVVVAAFRAVQHEWVPVGDNGLIAIRARDVFSSHPPLLYTWSSASVSAGFGFNHPGPLLFDLLAVPTALTDSWAGLAIGAALINAATVIGIAVFAYRRGGPLLSTAATAVTAALCWTMGSSLLFDPWSPNSLLLPFLLFLLLVWSMSCGDLVALPFAAGVGSLLLGTNLGFGLLVPVIVLWGLIGLTVALRRRRRSDPESWPVVRRRMVRAVVIAVGVFVVCWIQPVIEQLTGDGEGNLTRASRALGDIPATLGAEHGLQLFAGAASRWMQPWSLRAGDWSYASVGLAAAVTVVGAGILIACFVIARRRRDDVATALVITAAVAAATGLVSSIRTPTDPLGVLAGYQTRWLWGLGAFLTFAVVATLARAFVPDGRRSLQVVAGFTALTLVLVVVNLPTRHEGSDAPDYTQPVVRDLNRQIADLEGTGTLFVDWRGEPRSQNYGSATLAELERRGIPFKVQDQVLVRSLGSNRRFTGTNATEELRVRTGDDADHLRGARRVAFHEALRPAKLRELKALKRQIAAHIRVDGLRLTRRGRAAIRRLGGRLPAAPRSSTGNGSTPERSAFDPEQLFASRAVVSMMQHHFLVLSPRWRRIFKRYVHLQVRRDTQTVGLFIRPVDGNRT
jgi:hypothetical protein